MTNWEEVAQRTFDRARLGEITLEDLEYPVPPPRPEPLVFTDEAQPIEEPVADPEPATAFVAPEPPSARWFIDDTGTARRQTRGEAYADFQERHIRLRTDPAERERLYIEEFINPGRRYHRLNF